MSECRNLASLTARPALQSAPTVNQLAREIDGLRAKIAALELELQRLEGRKVSRRVVEEMFIRSKRTGRPRKAAAKASEMSADSGPGGLPLRRMRALERWVEQQIQRLDQRCRDRARSRTNDATGK